jgi:hypothetical protein
MLVAGAIDGRICVGAYIGCGAADRTAGFGTAGA